MAAFQRSGAIGDYLSCLEHPIEDDNMALEYNVLA